MSYQERRTIVSLLTGVAVMVAYCVYAFGRYQSGLIAANDLKAWATTMLIFIGIGILASIAIQIVFHILTSIGIAIGKSIRNEHADDKEIEKSINAEMVEDEMGRLIELKAMRIGFFLTGMGFVAGLIALVLGYSAVVMLNILFLSASGASVLEGLTQIYFYRRGVMHA